MSTVRHGEVEVDSRGRVSLGRFGKSDGTRYQVVEDQLGVLTLTPVHSVPVTELPEWLALSIREADAGDTHPRPDFSRVA